MEFFSLGGGGEQAITYDLLIVLCLGQVKSGGRTPPYPPVPPALYCSPHSVKLKMLDIGVDLFFAESTFVSKICRITVYCIMHIPISKIRLIFS